MDSVKAYQDIIIEYFEGYSKIKPVKQPDIEAHVIADREHNHFQLLRIGWQGPQNVFSVVFHFEIKGGKVWFQRNTTELEVVDVLMEKGIPREDIVLGFRPPCAGPYTGFAAA